MERGPRAIGKLLIAAMATAAVAACGEGDQTASGPNIVARSEKCTGSTTMKNPGATVTSTEWVEGKLVVKAADVLNCARHDLTAPTYAVNGTEVAIRWTWKNPQPAAATACECERKLTFELSGLQQARYTVRLQRSE